MSAVKNDKINALSQQEIDEIEAEIAHLPDRKSAAIDALKIVQKFRGWVSDESLKATAKLLGMSDEELDGIATFYSLIYRRPVGEKVVMYCDSVSCWIMGCNEVRDQLKQKLQIEPGQTTADGKYTLLPVTCLGDCDHAPAMMVGDELHHDLTPESLDKIFEEDS